ncbi:MAG: hypothetical protein Ta2G_21800 [Termitinemataceae bacterium]|nr:MAG: hypothetical protein Ta2G_21800 [Termitinemataceae bacterium]
MHKGNKIFVLGAILLSILFSSCAGLQNGLFNFAHSSNELIVIGVSNRQRKREDEIQNAVNDAAAKIALYYGVDAKIFIAATNGTGFWDYSMDTDSLFKFDTEYEKYVDGLRYDTSKDSVSIDGAFLLKVCYKVSNPVPAKRHYKMIEERPQWIRKPPDKIGGFLTGIGYARPQQKLTDTILKAYQNSIASIVRRLSTKAFSRITTIDSNVFSQDIQISEGSIVEFFAYEIWRDPKTNGVWILALAKEK